MSTATGLKVTSINHVVLHVTDMERSKSFYTRVLGFEERGVPAGPNPTMTFLTCGAQGLDLFQVPDGDAGGGREMNHMALTVAGNDLDQVAQELLATGLEVSERTPRNTVFVTDPDGHRIEILVSPRPQAP